MEKSLWLQSEALRSQHTFAEQHCQRCERGLQQSPEDVLCLPNLHDGARWRYNIKTALENVCVYLLDVYSSSLIYDWLNFLAIFLPHTNKNCRRTL